MGFPDIRDRLLVYYKKYYSSEIMNLCVYSKKPMDELVKFVEDLCVKIPKLENFELFVSYVPSHWRRQYYEK